VKSDTKFNILENMSIMEEKVFESIFISIQFKDRDIICSTIYRPPQKNSNSVQQFIINNLESTLIKIDKTKKYCYLMGDYNLDLLATHNNNIELCSELMLEYNLYPLINKPTRIIPTSCSAIDHIWTNVTKIDIKSFIVVHEVSDHIGVTVYRFLMLDLPY